MARAKDASGEKEPNYLRYAFHNIYNYLTPGYLALCVMIGIAVSLRVPLAERLSDF